ncbi:MAG: HEAT repeat domain-containing protein [Calothrix sp. MO_167.B12]|nr:HEAT repeat domain-containing protein [Calothrix sp. MO_167.B12]
MELQQIETYLNSPDAQNRMKAIVELRHHNPEVVVPLLKQRMHDKEFMIRSYVAMGFGYKQTEEGFQALLDIIANEKDPNVRAEAANSLSKYGLERALPHLEELFEQESHWLVRQSIFAVMEEMINPETLLKMCQIGLQGQDPLVKQTAIANLGRLSETPQAETALEMLFPLAVSDVWHIRAKVAKALRKFDSPEAQAALMELRQDQDHRVVAATLEGSL